MVSWAFMAIIKCDLPLLELTVSGITQNMFRLPEYNGAMLTSHSARVERFQQLRNFDIDHG